MRTVDLICSLGRLFHISWWNAFFSVLCDKYKNISFSLAIRKLFMSFCVIFYVLNTFLLILSNFNWWWISSFNYFCGYSLISRSIRIGYTKRATNELVGPYETLLHDGREHFLLWILWCHRPRQGYFLENTYIWLHTIDLISLSIRSIWYSYLYIENNYNWLRGNHSG